MRGRLTQLARLLTDPDVTEAEPPGGADPLGRAVAAVADRSNDHPRGTVARPVWLPPLPQIIALGALPGGSATVGEPALRLSLGLIDRPAVQEQTTLTWAPVVQPNLAVTGTGRSGRSSALLTVIAAAGLAANPGDVEVYGITLGGTAMRAAREWPHVAGLAEADDPDFAGRLLRLVIEEIDRRERPCEPPDRPAVESARPPAMLLVVDDWAPTGALDGQIDRLIMDIAVRGPAVGVATAVAVATGTVLRGRVAGAFGTRIELRPADAFDSAIDRRTAASLPADVPGRALTADGIAQLAAPPDPLGPEPVVVDLQRRWADRRVPRRLPLPERVELGQMRSARRGGRVPESPDGGVRPHSRGGPGHTGPDGSRSLRIQVGVEERHGPGLPHDLGRPDPHLVVLGDPGSGRTMVLRSIARQLAENCRGPAPLLVAVDLRGDLLAADPPLGWTASATRIDQVAPLVTDLLRYLAGPPVVAPAIPLDPGAFTTGTPVPSGTTNADPTAHLERRAPLVVLVDDEELLAGGLGHPLTPLLSAARSGADVGLHLVVARSCGGFGRARFEPLHQMLSDLGTPTLLLSSSPEEGRVTHRLLPRPLPPGRAQWAIRGRPTRLLQTPLDDHPARTRAATRTDTAPSTAETRPAVQ